MDIQAYTPADWHWIVGGDETKFWSSAAGIYVDSLPDGAGVTRIASEAELTEVLAVYGIAGPVPPVLTIIPKNLIWERATDDEADQMEAMLQAQPVRLRRIYEGATHISTSDELFGALSEALVALFGPVRAGVLLTPTA